MRTIINTDQAPAAIGTYSQAVRAGDFVYVSGQIPLDPKTGHLIDGDFKAHVRQVFLNLKAVVTAANAKLSDTVKLTVFLTDMQCFQSVNEVMSEFFIDPYPARAAVGVAELPRGVSVEMDVVVYAPL